MSTKVESWRQPFLAENQPSKSMGLLGHPLLISVKMIRERRHPIFTATMAGDRLMKCCAYHARQTWSLNNRCCTYDIDEDTRPLWCDMWCWQVTLNIRYLRLVRVIVTCCARRATQREAMQCNAARAAQHKKSNPHTDVVGNWKRFILKGNVEFLTFNFETCPHMDKKTPKNNLQHQQTHGCVPKFAAPVWSMAFHGFPN